MATAAPIPSKGPNPPHHANHPDESPDAQPGVVYCSPGMFAPFNGYPGVCAIARDMRMHILWCNDEYARMCGKRVEELKGTTLHDLMTKEMADERRDHMLEIWNSGRPGRYVQVWQDHRYLTTVWRLAPVSFGCDGVFVLMTRSTMNQMSGLDMVDVGLITTPHLDLLGKLSRRELEVLYHTAMGMSTEDIAKHIHRASKTVENHIASIMDKMGYQRRTELVRFAVERGILGFAESEWSRIAARKADGRERS